MKTIFWEVVYTEFFTLYPKNPLNRFISKQMARYSPSY